MGEFIANITIVGEPGANSIRLCLTGENAGWFYLEGRTIRLNSSFSRGLDREVQGSILMASLTCYEENTKQNEFRVMVEILDENDNMPYFIERSIQPRYISELTGVNTPVFSVKAKDADGDIITYIIDQTSPDASYFRIDLPNSGVITLNKPLDFETKTQLLVVIYAVEMNTFEKYNTTATVRVNVLDGDDQYPQFLPCSPVSEHAICTNPVYTANVSEDWENSILHFSPGPIHAEDGDRDIKTPLIYTILSGEDNGRFTINHDTGEITLRRRIESRLMTPSFRLLIMAAQVNDPKKYTVATAFVHVVAENRFPPYFNKTTYKGFIIENSSPATLVSTYGNKILIIQATDRDFRDGINPKMAYALHPVASSAKLYHITEDGILIAKATQLSAFDRHILEVVATDQETGEVANATVDIEVLQRGQAVPRSPFGEERLFGDVNVGIAGGLASVLLLLAVAALCLLLRLLRRWRHRRDPEDRGSVALGKNPNVVMSGRPTSFLEEAAYHNEAFMDHESSSGELTGKPGSYIKRNEMPPLPGQAYSRGEAYRSMPLSDMLPILVPPKPLPKISSVTSNGKTPEKYASFTVEKVKNGKVNILGEKKEVVTRVEDLLPTSQQASFITALDAPSEGSTQEERNAGDGCEPNIQSGPREKSTQALTERSGHSVEKCMDDLLPTSQTTTLFTPAETTQDKQDTHEVGASSIAKILTLKTIRCHCDIDNASEENLYKSMDSEGDNVDTTTDEKQFHKAYNMENSLFRRAKHLQKNDQSEHDQETMKTNDIPKNRLIHSSSVNGLLYFVEDSPEF
ncbi:protocadherin-15 [Hoplias malabaricus]|uniref:protocadherin-15 n=1 Tax=Hoplias malabaricus TaxID=27720 RepID=UPI003461E131